MKRYLYKNIVLKKSCGTWRVYYDDIEHGMFLLALGLPTKQSAYNYGKAEVDYLNEK